MAINKPSYCYPYGESIDFAVSYESTNNITGISCSGAQYIQCKVNTNNKRVTGYLLTLTDSDGKEIWSPKYITPISKLNRIDYGPRQGEDHGDGTNGSTLIIPFIQNSAYIFSHNSEIYGCANCLYSSIDYYVDYYLPNSLSTADWDVIINNAVVGSTFLKCDDSDPVTPNWSIGIKQTDGTVDYDDLGGGLYYIQIRLGSYGGQILKFQNRDAGGDIPIINPTDWLIYFDDCASSSHQCNFTSVPVVLGQEYFWKIKLYQGEIQEEVFFDFTSYYLDGVVMPYDFSSKEVRVYYGVYSQTYDVNQYDILIGEGQIMGSTGERLQIKPTDAVLQKKWVQLGHVEGTNDTIVSWEPWGSRGFIENYDVTFGHIYPFNNSYLENIFEQNPDLNGCCVYQHSNTASNVDPKEVVKLATTTLSENEQGELIYQIFAGGDTIAIDNTVPQQNDLILIKDLIGATGKSNYSFLNGVYRVSLSSAWSRSGNYNNWGSLLNSIILVEQGAVNNGRNFESTTIPEGTIGQITGSGVDAIRPYAAKAIIYQNLENHQWYMIEFRNGGWYKTATEIAISPSCYYLVPEINTSTHEITSFQYGKMVDSEEGYKLSAYVQTITSEDLLYNVRPQMFIRNNSNVWRPIDTLNPDDNIKRILGDDINFIEERPIQLYPIRNININTDYVNISSENQLLTYYSYSADDPVVYIKQYLEPEVGQTFLGELSTEIRVEIAGFCFVGIITPHSSIFTARYDIYQYNGVEQYDATTDLYTRAISSTAQLVGDVWGTGTWGSVIGMTKEYDHAVDENNKIMGQYRNIAGIGASRYVKELSSLSDYLCRINFGTVSSPVYEFCTIVEMTQNYIKYKKFSAAQVSEIQTNSKTYIGVFTIAQKNIGGDQWHQLSFTPITTGVSTDVETVADNINFYSQYIGGINTPKSLPKPGYPLVTYGKYPSSVFVDYDFTQCVARLNLNNSLVTYLKPDINLEPNQYIVFNEVDDGPRRIGSIDKEEYGAIFINNDVIGRTTLNNGEYTLNSKQGSYWEWAGNGGLANRYSYPYPNVGDALYAEYPFVEAHAISITSMTSGKYSSVTNSDTKEPYKYQIKSYFKASDYNPVRYGLTGDIGFNYVLYEGDPEYASYTIQDQNLSFILDNTVYSTNKTFLISYSPAADSYFQGFIRLEGYYRQTFGSSWSHYRMALYDNDFNLVQDTGEVYSGDFIKKFYVPLDENGSINYYCLLIVEDRNGEIYTCAAQITMPQSVNLSGVQLSTTYNYDLQCIDVVALGVASNNYTLYRMEKNKVGYDIVEIFKPQWDNYTVHDFNITNNRQYKYMLQSTKYQTPIGSVSYVATPGRCWSIVELLPADLSTQLNNNASAKKKYIVDENNMWLFKYNGDFGSQNQNILKSEQQTLGRYSRIGHGLKNNIAGSVTALLGQDIILGTREDGKHGYYEKLRGSSISSNGPIDLLNLWRSFVVSNNPKLLKDVKGQKWIVQVMSGQNTPMSHVEGQPDTISFSWIEIEDTDNIIITKTID